MGGLTAPIKRDRRSRIEKLKYWLKYRRDEFKDLDELLAKFCLEEGVSMHTARYDYLKLLRLAGEVDEE